MSSPVYQIFAASGSWLCPVGVSAVNYILIGGGGGGGGSANVGSGGGGAGGQCVTGSLSVTAGTSYTVTVGAAGGGGAGAANGTAGGDSWLSTSGTAIAKGGAAGLSLANGGTKGSGSTTGGIGTTVHAGGDGSNGGSSTTGGAGGGGGGSTGTGQSASSTTAGVALNLYGGSGGAGVTSSGNGNAGGTSSQQFGGGGSGGYNSTGTTSRTGGAGAAGGVILYWTAPASPYWSENFDGVTAPALPANLSTTGGSGFAAATSTTKAFSGSNSLKLSGLSGSYGFAWVPSALDGNFSNVQMEAKYKPSAISGGASNYWVIAARCLVAPSGATLPGNCYTFVGNFDGEGFFQLNFNNAAGSQTQLTNNSGLSSATFSATDWYRIILTVVDSPGTLYVLVSGYIQRQSDGAWLYPDASWNTGPQTACVSTLSTQSYPSGWASGTFGVAGCFLNSGQIAYVDDVIYSASPALVGVSPSSPPAAGSNEVELVPSATTASDAGQTGHSVSQLNQSGFGSYYQSTAVYGANMVLDAGAANTATPVAALTAPAFVTDSVFIGNEGSEIYGTGALIEGATSSGGPWTLLGQLATNDYPRPNLISTTRLDYNATPGPFRYFRLRVSQQPAMWSQFRMVVQWASGISWRPCRPAIILGSGREPTGTVFSLSSTSGILNSVATQLYYTTDGTTPALSGGVPTGTTTLYSGPVAIPANAPAQTTVKAIAYNSGGTTTASEVTTAFFTVAKKIVPDSGTSGNTLFSNGSTVQWPDNWYDSDGNLLETNSACIQYDPASTAFFLVGEPMNTGNDNAPPAIRGFRGYKSASVSGGGVDYFNWSHVGLVLPPCPVAWFIATSSTGVSNYLTRCHFLVNPSPLDPNKKYAAWAHLGAGINGAAVVATAPAFNGPWTWQNYYYAGGTLQGDMNVFYDVVDDGTGAARNKAYLIFAAANNTLVQAVQLDPATDWTTPTGPNITIGPTGREGVAMFFFGGYYYLVSSFLTGFGSGSTQLEYQSATTIAGLSGSTLTTIWHTTPGATTSAANVQSTHIFSVPGLIAPAFILMADNQDAGVSGAVHMYNSRMAWYPISTIADGANNVNAFAGGAGTLSVVAVTSWDASFLPPAITVPNWIMPGLGPPVRGAPWANFLRHSSVFPTPSTAVNATGVAPCVSLWTDTPIPSATGGALGTAGSAVSAWFSPATPAGTPSGMPGSVSLWADPLAPAGNPVAAVPPVWIVSDPVTPADSVTSAAAVVSLWAAGATPVGQGGATGNALAAGNWFSVANATGAVVVLAPAVAGSVWFNAAGPGATGIAVASPGAASLWSEALGNLASGTASAVPSAVAGAWFTVADATGNAIAPGAGPFRVVTLVGGVGTAPQIVGRNDTRPNITGG